MYRTSTSCPGKSVIWHFTDKYGKPNPSASCTETLAKFRLLYGEPTVRLTITDDPCDSCVEWVEADVMGAGRDP